MRKETHDSTDVDYKCIFCPTAMNGLCLAKKLLSLVVPIFSFLEKRYFSISHFWGGGRRTLFQENSMFVGDGYFLKNIKVDLIFSTKCGTSPEVKQKSSLVFPYRLAATRNPHMSVACGNMALLYMDLFCLCMVITSHWSSCESLCST